MVTLLSKQDCLQAIADWNIYRSDYSFLKTQFATKRVFNLDNVLQNWLSTNSNNDYIHIYLGYYNEKIIFIFVSLNAAGQEVDLVEFPIALAEKLTTNIDFVQEETILKTNSVCMDSEFQVLSTSECNSSEALPFPETNILETVKDIKNWNKNIHNWLFTESTQLDKSIIPQALSIPLASLITPNTELNKMGIWILKKLETTQFYYPTLVFATVEESACKSNTLTCKKIDNWATPVPPFLALRPQFSFLPI